MKLVPASARGRRTRDRLLAAAEEVFGERGYETASIAEITQRAGVGQGTFYLYFADKKDAFIGLVADLSHRLRAELATAIEHAPERLAVEEAGLVAFFDFVARHQNLYRIVRQAEFVDERAHRRYYADLAAGYGRGLRRAAERREIATTHPEALAYALMGIADFLGMRWVLWEGRRPPKAVVAEAMRFIRSGIQPGPTPPTEGDRDR